MTRTIFLPACAAALATARIILDAAPADAVTLEETVGTTLVTNPEIGSIRNNRRAIDQELQAARGQYFPSVDARGAFGHEYTNNSSSRGRSGRPPFGESGGVDMNRYESGATSRQLLFGGFGVDSDVARQRVRATRRHQGTGRLEPEGARRLYPAVRAGPAITARPIGRAERAVRLALDLDHRIQYRGLRRLPHAGHLGALAQDTQHPASGRGPQPAVAVVAMVTATVTAAAGRRRWGHDGRQAPPRRRQLAERYGI